MIALALLVLLGIPFLAIAYVEDWWLDQGSALRRYERQISADLRKYERDTAAQLRAYEAAL